MRGKTILNKKKDKKKINLAENMQTFFMSQILKHF